MKLYCIFLSVLLAGCSTTYIPVPPVERTFPSAVPAITEACPNLKKIENRSASLSEVLSVVSENYSLYYQCQAKVQGWNQWYQEQRNIFDRIR